MNQSNWEHVGYGVLILFAVRVLLFWIEFFGVTVGPYMVGAIVAIAFFYGRETRDSQINKSLSNFRMLNPSRWTPDGRRDFFPMVATVIVVSTLIESLLP